MERVGINGAALTSELLSAREELPVELDFVLPDDCPDIAKILRGSFRLGQNAAVQTDGGILAEGSVCADIWYIADTGVLFRATGRTAFSKKLDCALSPESQVAPAATGTNAYCNARTVNQRRIECKGAILIGATYTLPSQQAYMSDHGGEDMETLTETRAFSCAVRQTFARTALDEERPLPDSVPDPAALLRCEGKATITDRKQVEGKIMVRGEIQAILCCLAAEGTPFQTRFAVPFSQLVELEGIHEASECDVRCEMLWCDAELRTNETGQKRTVALRGEAMLTVSAHETQELTAAADAFGLKFHAEPVHTVLEIPRRIAAVNQSLSFEWACDPPVTGASAVWEAWSAAAPQPIRRAEEGLVLPVRVTVFGFLLDQNERPAFLEKTGEITIRVSSDATDPIFSLPSAEVENLRLTIGEDGVHCSGTVQAQGVLYDRIRWDVLEGVNMDADAPISNAPTPLALFWAEDDVSLWELAKQYAVPLSALHMQDGLALVERTQG